MSFSKGLGVGESSEEVFCFTGAYEHTLDAKGRVTLPSMMRRHFSTTVKVVLDPLGKDSVLVFRPEDYVSWMRRYFDGKPVDPRSVKAVQLQKFMTRYAAETDIDNAGRISIDATLRRIASLEKDVTIIGCGDHLQIMNREKADAEDDVLLTLDFSTP